MMGLGDRVEAWARRFGVPPPPGVDVDEAQGGPAEDRSGPGAPPDPKPERCDDLARDLDGERFTRGARERR